MDKIIFLDVDGVLNSQVWFSSEDYRRRRDIYNEKYKNARTRSIGDVATPEELERHRETLKGTHVDPAAVAELNRVLVATGAKIVLSSTWRIADFTRDAIADSGIHEYAERYLGRTRGSRGNEVRGHEISDWIQENDFKGKFVILDDDRDMAHLKKHLVQTNFFYGLTSKQGDEIIRRLTAE